MLIQGNYRVIVNLFGMKKSACAAGFVLQNNKADAAVRAQMAWYRYEPAGKAGIFEQFFSAHDMRACRETGSRFDHSRCRLLCKPANSIGCCIDFIRSGEDSGRETDGAVRKCTCGCMRAWSTMQADPAQYAVAFIQKLSGL